MKEEKKQQYMTAPWFASGSANLGFKIDGQPAAPGESTHSSRRGRRSARVTLDNANTSGPTGAINEANPPCLAQPASHVARWHTCATASVGK